MKKEHDKKCATNSNVGISKCQKDESYCTCNTESTSDIGHFLKCPLAQPQDNWEERFDKQWKNVECSAHERTSSAACICDSLEDINSDYGYEKIKAFIRQLLEQARKQERQAVIAMCEEIKNEMESPNPSVLVIREKVMEFIAKLKGT